MSPGAARRFILPLLWLGAALLALFLNHPSSSPVGSYDTFYVVAHRRFGLSLAGALTAIGATYLLLESVERVRYRRSLGYAHLILAAVGVTLVLAPRLALASAGLPQRHIDPRAVFSLWTKVAATGYVVVLASVAVFVVVLGDALRLTLARRTAG